MDGPMMNDDAMFGGMMICMAATALFTLIIGVTVIVQAVLQWRILRALRRLAERKASELPT